MKILTWCKFVVSGSLSLLVLLLALQAKHSECISKECQDFKLKKLKSDDDFVKDASARIKDSFKKAGHPSSIRCTYTLSGANTISATTKVYYENDYRHRPDFYKDCYLHESVKADKVVEVFYKKHDKSMSLSFKDPRHRHEKISSKKVKIFNSLSA